MKARVVFVAVLFAAGCFPEIDYKDAYPDDTGETVLADADGDGFVGDDCDDGNSLVNPGMPDACGDGIDQDCDGVDASCGDLDGDGFAEEDGDCDDDDADYYPGAPEADCTDPNDYNCDGSVAYADADADGWVACEDCDDIDSDVYPSADETWYDGEDADCDGASDYDADADGYDSANFGGDDCDDLVGASNPGGTEVCDDADNDCNGLVDDGVGDPWYVDNDGDGYGDAATAVTTCDGPVGYVENALDCDDADGAVSPVAAEACNGADDDCDGSPEADETDADGDLVLACEDCDDADATRSPLIGEVCGDGIDNDCDAANDASGDTYFADGDGDGYGNAADMLTQCDVPSGYVMNADDCDDTRSSVNPAGTETCDGTLDEDCDGTVDENDASDASAWYADSDADGYGDSVVRYLACEQPAGYVSVADDCDDAAAGTNPGALEVCDGATDEDCDGATDEGVTIRYYADADGDTWGSPGTWIEACAAPAGYVTDNSDCDDADVAANNDDLDADGDTTCAGDCDDADASLDLDDMDGDGWNSCEGECNDSESDVHPGATEACDGADNDCDGVFDDGLTFADYYADFDSDGYGDAARVINQCEQPAGYVENADDCDDADYTVSPAAAEACDGEDDDCDGSTDEDFDADADGAYAAACSYGTDCDDADFFVNPSASEACDGIDNDCDGLTDENFDADGDGYASEAACAWGDDCDDADPDVSPSGKEISVVAATIVDQCSDGLDNDCDGLADAADPWDCDDDDADGIENGIDVLVAMDGSGDGDDDTLCVIADANLSMASPWNGYGAVFQGDAWGGFSALNGAYAESLFAYADSDGDGMDDVNAWCVDFVGAIGAGNWSGRLVSAIAEDGASAAPSTCAGSSSSTTWVPMDIADYCAATDDEWCRIGYADYDGCGEWIGTTIQLTYSASEESIVPYN